MEVLEYFLTNIVVYQLVTNLIKATVGAGLCFGALKWRRGLLTTTAVSWGVFVGILLAIIMSDLTGAEGALIWILLGAVVFPILTYTVPGVNRFVLGFLVSAKLLFMFTTYLFKEGDMDIINVITMPLVAGTMVGLGLMMWTRMRISAFILACSFIGASEIAPVLAEWINQGLYAVTGDIGFLFDPLDFLFAFFHIELTDGWTLFFMIVLMILGCIIQFNNLKSNNIPPNTPLIGFEGPRGRNGQINIGDRTIDTL